MKKVVLLVLLVLHLVCPVHADQAYGRFGRFHEDGLLTTNVHPRGFTLLGTNPELNIRWGDPKAALSAVVTSINPTEKILAVEGGGLGAPSQIRYTLVYPGFSATFGKQLVLRFTNRSGKLVRVGLDPTRLKQGWLLVIPGDRYPAVPLLIKVPRGPGTKAWFTGDGLTVESPMPLGEVIFTTPTGLRPVASLSAAWKAVSDWGDAPIPVLQGISNEVTGAEITTTQTWNTPYAPISPIFSLALQAGFPARVRGPLVRTEIRTRYGPYTYIADKTSHVSLTSPVKAAPALYGEDLATPSGRLKAMPSGVPAPVGLWSLYPWLVAAERLPFDVRSNLIRTYRVRRAKLVLLDSAEPITGVHLQLPRSGNEKEKRDVDDVVSLARVVLVDHAFTQHVGDAISKANLKSSLAALVSAVQVRTDWLWGCVGRSDDGFQSLDANETKDVAAALAIAMQNPDSDLTPGETEEASVAFVSHAWSVFGRDALGKFASVTSMTSSNQLSGRLDETKSFENTTKKPSVDEPLSTSATDYLIDPYVSPVGQHLSGTLRRGADIGVMSTDGLRITTVEDRSIRDVNIDVVSGNARIRIVKLVVSDRWRGALVRVNGISSLSMQFGDELHILLAPFVGSAQIQIRAPNITAASYVFQYPLFGMMDWQNDIYVIGPGTSR